MTTRIQQSPLFMQSPGGTLRLALSALVLMPLGITPAVAAPTAQPGVHISVQTQGLNDPRGMALGPGGSIYVAEAGTTPGLFTPPPPPYVDPSTLTRTRCFVNWPVGPAVGGYTGRISRISADGHRTTVADGLPSTANNALIGGDRMGVGAVAFTGSRLFAVTAGAGCSHGHSEDNALLRVFGDGATAPVADLSNYLRGLYDTKSPLDADFEPDGTWYSLVHAFGGLYSVEPNRGAFVRIDYRGITTVRDMIDAVSGIDTLGDGDKTFSALTQHKGAFYFGTLGRIDTDFAAFIYRVSADGSRVRQIAAGLHGVVGIAFDRQDRMYVLETVAAGVSPPFSDPTAGRLVRIERNGSITPLVTGLSFPTALIAGRHGEFYVTNCGYHCDDPARRPQTISLRNGQILRIDVQHAESVCDDDGEED